MDSQFSYFFRLSAVLEAMPDALVIIDDKARIMLINKQTEKMFGYQRTELLGEYREQLMLERFRQRQQQHRNNYITSPRTRSMGAGLALFDLHRDGKEFSKVTLSSAKIPVGDKPNIVRGKRILLIDDEPFLLKSIQRLLSSFHQVTTALGGREGLARLKEEGGKFDAIICDLTMPDIDGADIYYFLKQQFPSLEKHMVFISGGAYMPKLENFIQQEKVIYLEKPFNANALLKAIEDITNEVNQ
jgi:PAS domain S-box-containing protein